MIYFTVCAVRTALGASKNRYMIELKLSELFNLGMLLFFLVFVLFIGGVSLLYYPFPMNGFVLFGFIPFCYIIEGLMGEKKYYLLMAASLVATFLITWFSSVNVKSMNLKEEDLYLFKFRDYILSTGIEDPGIIVQFSFDLGLYTVLDVEPICYYFQTQTLNMDEVIDYQKQYLHSGEADFVVTSNEEAEGIGDRYDLVMTDHLQFYNFDQTYYLYQRNSNPVSE